MKPPFSKSPKYFRSDLSPGFLPATSKHCNSNLRKTFSLSCWKIYFPGLKPLKENENLNEKYNKTSDNEENELNPERNEPQTLAEKQIL